MEYSSAQELRAHNLKHGDRVYFRAPSRTHEGRVTISGDAVYLNFSGMNRCVFEEIGLSSDETALKIARAVFGDAVKRKRIDGGWPNWVNSGPEIGLLNAWKLSLALLEHLEGTRDIQTYLTSKEQYDSEEEA